MFKFLISILLGCAVYLLMTPTWQFTAGSYAVISIVLLIFAALIGMPVYLILNKWLHRDSLKDYSVKILISIALAFLLPLSLGRWFQIYMAKAKNLSQLGDMAMFTNGELSRNGKMIIWEDFVALSVSALMVTIIICTIKYLNREKK